MWQQCLTALSRGKSRFPLLLAHLHGRRGIVYAELEHGAQFARQPRQGPPVLATLLGTAGIPAARQMLNQRRAGLLVGPSLRGHECLVGETECVLMSRPGLQGEDLGVGEVKISRDLRARQPLCACTKGSGLPGAGGMSAAARMHCAAQLSQGVGLACPPWRREDA